MSDEEMTEVLAATKRLIGVRDNTNDARIVLCINDTAGSIMSHCRIDVMPRQIVSLMPALVVDKLMR